MYTPPSGFYVFSRYIAFYGIIMTIAILTAYFVAKKLAPHRGIKGDTVMLFALVCVPMGIIGARFLHVVLNADKYTFVEAVAFWRGFEGLSIYGAVIFGAIGVMLVCYFKKINFFKIADVIAPGVILAQAIGRWGNFFNQELYGPEVGFKLFPLSVFIEDTGNFHAAMFFYEFLANIAGFLVLLYIFKKTKQPGVVLAFYLIIYGTVRFVCEPFRNDSFVVGGLFRPYQLISIFIVLIGVAILVFSKIKKKRVA